MRKTKILIEQDPVAKGRPRLARSGIAFTPAVTRAAEAQAKLALKTQFFEDPYDRPIKVSMYFGIERPASVKPKKRPVPSVKPDLDNICKLYLDCGNGILWVDDSLICTLHLEKRYSEQGFIEILIEEMNI